MSTMRSTERTGALLRSVLRDQQDFTAVEVFSLAHERDEATADGRHYRHLLPVDGPKPGEQYAFEVDLDRCTGCKACVTGCHNRNGLDAGETWRSVGLSIGGNDPAPLLQHVTAACHHCLDPACLDGCPVRAYEKDPLTGIVRHLDDQCIGCQYCVMKCPYGVPQYNEKRGIVRKCDLCTERLAVGEAPACVQSCPNEAIRITAVSDSLGAEACREGFASVPGSPDAAYTRPTTRYVSRSPIPDAMVEKPLEPADSHPSLVAMLTLTQAAVGLFLCGRLSEDRAGAAVLTFALAGVGMTAALFHLGRPLWGFRAVLGLRTSWLSREIVAFSVFIGLTGLVIASSGARAGLTVLAAIAGVVAVSCSAMVYEDTPRAYWASPKTRIRFALSALSSGMVLVAAFRVDDGHAAAVSLAVAAMAIKISFELTEARSSNETRRTAGALLRGPLRRVFGRRLIVAAVSLFCLLASPAVPAVAWLAAFLWLVGEAMERDIFFRTGVPPQRP